MSAALISWYLWAIPNIWPSSCGSSYIVDTLYSAGTKWYTHVQFPHHMVQYSSVTTQYFTSGITPPQQTVHQWKQWNPFTCSAESWLTARPNCSWLWGTARVVLRQMAFAITGHATVTATWLDQELKVHNLNFKKKTPAKNQRPHSIASSSLTVWSESHVWLTSFCPHLRASRIPSIHYYTWSGR